MAGNKSTHQHLFARATHWADTHNILKMENAVFVMLLVCRIKDDAQVLYIFG